MFWTLAFDTWRAFSAAVNIKEKIVCLCIPVNGEIARTLIPSSMSINKCTGDLQAGSWKAGGERRSYCERRKWQVGAEYREIVDDALYFRFTDSQI